MINRQKLLEVHVDVTLLQTLQNIYSNATKTAFVTFKVLFYVIKRHYQLLKTKSNSVAEK